jgi:hypothetical protein
LQVQFAQIANPDAPRNDLNVFNDADDFKGH